METTLAQGAQLGTALLCAALAVPRATFYRALSPEPTRRPRQPSPRALSQGESTQVLAVLHEPRFVDLSPSEVYATLLDEGRYLCSERTMYRILAQHSEIRARRDQLIHARRKAPELLAIKPNELWSWDITKLLGPAKWTYFYLYTILDVFSRYVVGWMIAPRESAALAEKLIETTLERQRISRNQLTIHADNGSSMTSKPVAFLLADLGVTKTHSRPYVSNDNPFSEAQFKTLKYRPDFPDRFGCLEDARAFHTDFVAWYNTEHHHSGLALLTPHDVHHGLANARLDARALVLATAYGEHPERFLRGLPAPGLPPTAVWINKPVTPSTPIAESDDPPPESAGSATPKSVARTAPAARSFHSVPPPKSEPAREVPAQ
jgi:putative transposase